MEAFVLDVSDWVAWCREGEATDASEELLRRPAPAFDEFARLLC